MATGREGWWPRNSMAGDASDGGHQDDSEERADVEDQQLFLEGPGEGEEEEDADGEEDVAADVAAWTALGRG